MSYINDHFRSRRSLARILAHRVYGMLGAYSLYASVDWGEYRRVVFVCKGNICRSAFAEAVLLAAGIDAVSCGIDTVNGNPANEKAASVASAMGIDLTGHRTRRIQDTGILPGDILVCMEPGQAAYVKDTLNASWPLTLLGLWGSPATPYIADPYGGTDAYFDHCFAYIRNSVNEIANKIR